MKIILQRYKKYYPKYDAVEKTLYLQGKIPMKEWQELKTLIKIYQIELDDIRVNWSGKH